MQDDVTMGYINSCNSCHNSISCRSQYDAKKSSKGTSCYMDSSSNYPCDPYNFKGYGFIRYAKIISNIVTGFTL